MGSGGSFARNYHDPESRNPVGKATASWVKTGPKSAYHLTATEFRSLYYENVGNGFKAHPLPVEAQFGPVYGIVVDDFNRDGYKDALLIGNSYASETIGGWYDASKGTLLLGGKRSGFVVSNLKGLTADKEAKSIVQLHQQNAASMIIIGNNNSPLQVFSGVNNDERYTSLQRHNRSVYDK